MPPKHPSAKRRGGAVLEGALLMPWYVLLFVGAFDWGFYSHALISVQGAARTAALYTSTNSATAADATRACTYALEELRVTANVGSGVTSCAGSPVVVTVRALNGPDGRPASEVTVTFTTVRLIPIPGLLRDQATFTRVCQMRVRG
jgi:Flp pilus assembly protein TadG